MRSIEREKRGVRVAQFAVKEQIVDEEGRLTGAYKVTYTAPETFYATVSPAAGNTYADGFGWGVSYDRTMILHEIGTGISESSIVWVDSVPETDGEGMLVYGEDGEPTVPYEYVIASVAESYNVTNVALRKRQ